MADRGDRDARNRFIESGSLDRMADREGKMGSMAAELDRYYKLYPERYEIMMEEALNLIKEDIDVPEFGGKKMLNDVLLVDDIKIPFEEPIKEISEEDIKQRMADIIYDSGISTKLLTADIRKQAREQAIQELKQERIDEARKDLNMEMDAEMRIIKSNRLSKLMEDMDPSYLMP